MVRSIVIHNHKTGHISEIEADGVFVNIGEVPNSQIADNAGIRVDDHGYIIVDQKQRTNIPRVYADGDVTTCPVRQIGVAVGAGIISAEHAYGAIRQPYYSNE